MLKYLYIHPVKFDMKKMSNNRPAKGYPFIKIYMSYKIVLSLVNWKGKFAHFFS